MQQLVLSPGGDDDMGTLLGLMPTASVTDLELKTHILKVIICYKHIVSNGIYSSYYYVNKTCYLCIYWIISLEKPGGLHC